MSKSSSDITTVRPSDVSNAFARSRYATSSPHTEQRRTIEMRPPSAACTWWKRTSFSSVAAYTFTGTLTSPNASEPFHIARIATSVRPPNREAT